MGLSIFAWLGATAIGVSLGLLGSGGSILTVPVLVYLVGQEEKLAIAGSLAIVGSIALAGSLPKLWNKQVEWKVLLVFAIPSMLGTYLGATLATWVSGLMQLTLFAFVMLLASWRMLAPMAVSSQSQKHKINWIIAPGGLAVGMITGLVGVGGGFLIVPALVILGGLSMRNAVGTSLVIIALQSFTGFWKYLHVLEQQGLILDWHVIGVVTALGVVGSIIGNSISNRVDQQKLKKIFGLFLIVMAIYILIRTLPSVWPF
jgi:uncharacterized membrane protein YfcA